MNGALGFPSLLRKFRTRSRQSPKGPKLLKTVLIKEIGQIAAEWTQTGHDIEGLGGQSVASLAAQTVVSSPTYSHELELPACGSQHKS